MYYYYNNDQGEWAAGAMLVTIFPYGKISLIKENTLIVDKNTTFEKLLTYQQAAKILNISEPTLRRWVMERRIPFIKIGRLVRFDPDILMKWISEHSVPVGGRR